MSAEENKGEPGPAQSGGPTIFFASIVPPNTPDAAIAVNHWKYTRMWQQCVPERTATLGDATPALLRRTERRWTTRFGSCGSFGQGKYTSIDETLLSPLEVAFYEARDPAAAMQLLVNAERDNAEALRAHDASMPLGTLLHVLVHGMCKQEDIEVGELSPEELAERQATNLGRLLGVVPPRGRDPTPPPNVATPERVALATALVAHIPPETRVTEDRYERSSWKVAFRLGCDDAFLHVLNEPRCPRSMIPSKCDCAVPCVGVRRYPGM